MYCCCGGGCAYAGGGGGASPSAPGNAVPNIFPANLANAAISYCYIRLVVRRFKRRLDLEEEAGEAIHDPEYIMILGVDSRVAIATWRSVVGVHHGTAIWHRYCFRPYRFR
jgi:hypothetical protein